ncbi:MAG: SDR family oxidoreductase [Cyanobacteria bacterium J06649_4]
MSGVPRRALITGASSGIGEATARVFAQAGFDVAMVARSGERLAALAKELSAFGVKVQGFVIDLSKIETVKENIARVIADFGPVQVLVNNAGMGYTGALAEMPLADWQQVMTLNVTSLFLTVQALLPQLRQQANGLVINIASIAAQQAFPNWGAYGVSKAAVVALSDAIAAEEASHGIRVVTLSPGAVDTSIWDTDTVEADFARTDMLRPETVAKTLLHIATLPPEAVISHLTMTPSQGAL